MYMQPVRLRFLHFLGALAGSLDLMSPALYGHHLRVGYMASRLAQTLGLTSTERTTLLIAGLLHDAGALTFPSHAETLNFDESDTKHCELGYHLFKDSELFGRAARLIRHHHMPWAERHDYDEAAKILFKANILFTADRVDAKLSRERPVADQIPQVLARMESGKGEKFCPDALRALRSLARQPEFLRTLQQGALPREVYDAPGLLNHELTMDELLDFSGVFSRCIDLRSRFTATHSRGVAEAAAMLAERAGFADPEVALMRVAGNLHDLGKLGIPSAILEKPDRLTSEEYACIKTHVTIADRIMAEVPGCDALRRLMANHHERVDGRGYPDGVPGRELCLGSRIMAVADVFTALTEDRPYREGMQPDQAMTVVRKMAGEGALDSDVVFLLENGYADVNLARVEGQACALREFQTVIQ